MEGSRRGGRAYNPSEKEGGEMLPHLPSEEGGAEDATSSSEDENPEVEVGLENESFSFRLAKRRWWRVEKDPRASPPRNQRLPPGQ